MDVKLIYIMFFVSGFGCFAQTDSIQKTYFKSYDDKVTASVYYLDTSNNFQIVYPVPGEETETLDLIPNRKEQLGASLSFKFVDLSFGFSPKFLNANKDNTDSKLLNFNARVYHKHWMQSFTYFYQKGFYVSQGGFSAAFPGFRSLKIGGATSYIFNKNFSYKTIASQNEWQTKSAGSFILNFSAYYTNLKYRSAEDRINGDTYLLSLAPSYYYNLVLGKHILVSVGLSMGAGINITDGDTKLLYEVDSSLKTGYNSDSFFVFMNVNHTNFIQSETNSIGLNDNISTVKITAGYRFNAPKKVTQIYEKINKKTGL
jgi:hypothetical protein